MKSTNKRGLIDFSATFEPKPGGGNNVIFDLPDAKRIRSYLLYWDKLDLPQSSMFVELPPDLRFLADEGFIEQTASYFDTPSISEGIRQAHIHAFHMHEVEEPGCWSTAISGQIKPFTDRDFDKGRGVLVQLQNAIPVPDVDVPFEDIIAFKRKRYSELLALRHHLEEVYQKITNAGDGPLAANTEIGRLTKAINDNLAVTREARLPHRMIDLSANLSVPFGTALGALSGGADLVAILEGAVGGTAIQLGLRQHDRLNTRIITPTPYAYTIRFHSEVFLRD